MGITPDRAKKYRKENDERKGGGGKFQSELKTVIKPGNTIVRLVGDVKSCLRAWVEGDDGKVRPFIMQEYSPLYKLYAHVMTSTGTGQNRVYHFQDTDAFETLTGGGNFKKNWKPRWTYCMNCIPREEITDDDGAEYNIAVENEHLTLLAQNEADIGIGPMLFDALLDVAENDGDTDGYDVVFTKKGTGTDTDYGCMRASRRNTAYGKLVVTRENLSAAESSWEIYDLNSLVQPSRASYVLKHLAQSIQAIDHELKTGYLDELRAEADGENGSGATRRRAARATKPKAGTKTAGTKTGRTRSTAKKPANGRRKKS